MTQGSGENTGLPSFFQDDPWLDFLAQRGVELTPDFVGSEALSAPAVKRITPVIESEPVASSPTTTLTAMSPAAGFPRELVVRLEVPSELLEAIRELKEAVIMALSVSQRQATIVPIYIPISVAQMAPQAPPQAPSHVPAEVSGEVICPKCGRPGKLYEHRRGGRTYVLVLHGRQKCYLGPADAVKVKWPHLAERALLNNAQHGRAGILSPPGHRASSRVLSSAQPLNLPQRAFLLLPGCPSGQGAGLESPWAGRPSWVRIPPPAPKELDLAPDGLISQYGRVLLANRLLF